MIKNTYDIADPKDAQAAHDLYVATEQKVSTVMAHAIGYCSAWTVTEILSKSYGHHFVTKPAKVFLFGGLTGIGTVVKNQVTKSCSPDKEEIAVRAAHKINKKREKLGLPPLNYN